MVRRVIRRIHLWLALSLGLLVVLLGLSSSILVYRGGLDRTLNPGLWTGPAPDKAPALDTVLATARTEGPDGRIAFVRLPDGPTCAYEVWIATDAGRTRVYVAPNGQRVLGIATWLARRTPNGWA